MSRRVRLPPSPARVLVLAAVLIILLFELVVTAITQDLASPTTIGTDPSNYYAAGERLNAGHPLYGPLVATDRPVPGYPGEFPAPLLSPPLVAVLWRPLAALGEGVMTIWWAIALAVVIGLVGAFTTLGGRWTLNGILALLLLGLPIALVWPTPYRFPGDWSPLAFAALSGNLDAYLTGLCVIVWLATRHGKPRLAGSVAGLAAVLKLSPFALVLWFVVRRDRAALSAFLVTVAVLVLIGLVGAGPSANITYVRLFIGAAVTPTPLSLPGMLQSWLRLDPHIASLATVAMIPIGLGLIQATRSSARISFLVTILVVIYCSPVVLVGNFALLLAALAPEASEPTTPGVPAVGSPRRDSRILP
jgi:hypothetical protein